MSDVHDATYYGKCMVAGVLACGLTHAAVCPLDIVKCRRQVNIEFPFTPMNAIEFSFTNRAVCINLGFTWPLQEHPWWFQDYLGWGGFQRIHRCKFLIRVYDFAVRAGSPLSLDTPRRASESSASMKSSRMSTRLPLDPRPPTTRLLVSASRPPVLRSSPIASSALWKQ